MSAIAKLHVSQPGLRLKFATDAATAGEAIHQFSRAVAQQPYKDPLDYLRQHGGANLKGVMKQGEASAATKAFAAALSKLPFIAEAKAPRIAQAAVSCSLGRLLDMYMDPRRCAFP